MKNMTIGKRIILGFTLLLTFTVGLVVFANMRLVVIEHQARDINDKAIPALDCLLKMQKPALENNTIVYKHVYSPSPEDMQKLESEIAANVKALSEAYSSYEKLDLTSDERKEFAEIKEKTSKVSEKRSEIITASRGATTPEASAKLCEKARAELDPLVASFIDALNKMVEKEETRAKADASEIASDVSSTLNMLKLVAGIAVGLGIICAYFIVSNTNKTLIQVSDQLNSGAQETVSAAGQVASASQSLAEGASEQAASLEETSASLEEMTSMTKRNAENSDSAHAKATEARRFTEQSTEDMDKLSAAMGEMSKIIKSIDEIAFQTNILALNAAVEAARAGAAGAGFAVVADEVRNLAQRSADAARETSNKIEQGTHMAMKVKDSLDKTVVHVRDVDKLVDEITQSSKEQSQGIGQIGIALNQMDKVTQSSAASAEETASAAEELNAQSLEMQKAADELWRLIHGGSHSSSAAKQEGEHQMKFASAQHQAPAALPTAKANRLQIRDKS